MAISPARAAAFDVLLRVEHGAYAVELLHSERLEELVAADLGLATEIVMGVERWRSRLDAALSENLSVAIAKLDPEVLLALRMGAYQLMFLERVPAHASINESVELVKRARKRSAAGLVNAVLRKIAAARTVSRGGQILSSAGRGTGSGLPLRAPVEGKFDARELARTFAHPEWLVERWSANYGPEHARLICEFGQQVPEAVLRLPDKPEAAAEIEHELGAKGIELAPGRLMRSARRVVSGDVTKCLAVAERRAAIQDEASQLVAALVVRGRRILDCCAAPGGKTAAIADSNPDSQIVAVDVHEHRVRLLRKLVAKPNVSCLHDDIRHMPRAKLFDRVLVDAPCSGTGTLGRNPEIKWRIQPSDLSDLQARQQEILAAAAGHLEPGGRLIYATCSLEPEEGEQVVARLLDHHTDLKLLEMATELEELRKAGALSWPDIVSLVHGSFLRTVPGLHPCDGFFAAVLVRPAD